MSGPYLADVLRRPCLKNCGLGGEKIHTCALAGRLIGIDFQSLKSAVLAAECRQPIGADVINTHNTL